MPRMVGGDTEMVCSKLKRGNRFSKPNFELGPSFTTHDAVSNRFNLGRHKVGAQHYRELRISAFTEWSRAVA
jgi:putative transposase